MMETIMDILLGKSDTLRTHFSGPIILPGDLDYNQARKVWNGMINRYPALIVRPTDADDVIAAVNFARDNRLPISVRGGGHNVAGHGTTDGGIVIDLSLMRGIRVNPGNRTARAEGGVTWGELDEATQRYGLATPGGVFSRTGIAGLTLGGGFGWLRNKYGLSCDNLLSAEVVTADGRLIRASKDRNSDLLWGLRGGGGNFGIVTSFEYQLHRVGPEVMFAFTFYEAEDEETMKQALRFYRDFSEVAPDEVSTIAALGRIPAEPEVFPEAIHGRFFVLFGGLYAGSPAEGQRAMQPLMNFGVPMVNASGVRPYTEAQQVFDADYPDGHRYYWKSLNLMRLNEDTIDRIVKHARRQVSWHSTTDLWHIGGAVARGSADYSAFHGRQAAFLLNPEANWEHPDDDEANIAWARDFIEDMQEFSDGSRYLNFAGFQEEGDAMIRKAFGPQFARLMELKGKYDPDNLFNLNQNINPHQTNGHY